MKIFAFTLSMPNVGSWNGRWSGERDLYFRSHKLTNKQLETSPIEEKNYHYNFGDGWSANVSVKVIDSKERQQLQKHSKGFAGYEWMIDSIIKNGKIICEEEEDSK